MIDLLKGFLDQDWHTKGEILDHLLIKKKYDINERVMRRAFEKYNLEYCEGLHDSFVAHSNKGYLLTSDKEIIERSMRDDLSRLIKLSKRVYGIKKRFKEDSQLTLLPKKEMDAYEVLMRMKI